MKQLLIKSAIPLILLLSACAQKDEPLTANFTGPSDEKRWSVKELSPDLPNDWSSYGYLTFDMKSSTAQSFDLKLYDASGVRILSIHPFQGAWVRASVPLVHFQKMNTEGMDMAAIWKTPRPGYWIGFTRAVGPVSDIDSLGVSMRLPVGFPKLLMKNFRLTMVAEDSILAPVPLVDEFGQWIPREWPGKARSLKDLKSSWEREEKALGSSEQTISGYGGFTIKKYRSTGFFRVEKAEGVWWFIDPDGYPFFSAGSTCISSSSESARIRGREYIYSAMPPSELKGESRPGREDQVSFYTWNLFRRFGDDWYSRWKEMTVKRMLSWGLNTVANWSDPNLGKTHRIPYVASLGGWGIETGQMGMPDIFEPGYREKVDSAAKDQCEPLKDDPFLIGYFIGNEPPWPEREQELVSVILTGEETGMKRELRNYLAGGDTPERRKAFVYDTYSKFLEIVNSAVRKYDPNHLNLGIRYGGSAPDEIIQASKGFDVFSLNIYAYEPDQKVLQNIYNLTGLPIVIGEFHFGAPGRGMAPGLAQTKNYEERGVAYRYYVENAASHPALIGTHWFQWIDQPSTGRFDGENYNIGFLDVTDRPYQEMVNASRETFRRLYDVHSGRVPPESRKALVN